MDQLSNIFGNQNQTQPTQPASTPFPTASQGQPNLQNIFGSPTPAISTTPATMPAVNEPTTQQTQPIANSSQEPKQSGNFLSNAWNAIQGFGKYVSDQYTQAMHDLTNNSTAYAPAEEGQQGNLKQLEQTQAQQQVSDPVRRYGQDVVNATMSLLQGASGGIIKNPIQSINPESHIIQPIASTIGQIYSIGKLQDAVSSLIKAPTLAEGLAQVSPKLSFVAPLLTNIGAFGIYGQLDPQVKDRLGQFAKDAVAGTLLTGAGMVGAARYAIPLAFGTGVATAKVYGTNNHDAILNGVLFAALESANKLPGLFDSQFKNGTREFTPQEARDFVANSSLKNTPLGNDMIKNSFTAESQGKNLSVNLGAAEKGIGAKVLNMNTPHGIGYNIDLVNPSEAQAASLIENTTPQDVQNTASEAQVIPTESTQTVEQTQSAQPVVRVPQTFRSGEEETAFKSITDNPQQFVQNYTKDYQNEVNPDLALRMLPGYKGYNAAEFSRASGTAKALLYDHALDTNTGARNNTVLITAGGSGSGKTTAVSTNAPLREKYAIVLDTTFSNNSAVQDIQKALTKGYDVHINYVLRNPKEAWSEGVLPRVQKEGRVVSEGYFLKSHQDAVKNIGQAYEKYKDNPHVSFAFFHNTPTGASPISVDKVKQTSYNKEEVVNHIQKATDKAYAEQQLTKQQYEGTTKDRGLTTSSTVPGQLEQRNPEEQSISREEQVKAIANVRNSFRDIKTNNSADQVYQIKDITGTLLSNRPTAVKGSSYFDRLSTAKSFEEFTSVVKDIAKTDKSFASLYSDITRGIITRQDYEDLQKLLSQEQDKRNQSLKVNAHQQLEQSSSTQSLSNSAQSQNTETSGGGNQNNGNINVEQNPNSQALNSQGNGTNSEIRTDRTANLTNGNGQGLNSRENRENSPTPPLQNSTLASENSSTSSGERVGESAFIPHTLSEQLAEKPIANTQIPKASLKGTEFDTMESSINLEAGFINPQAIVDGVRALLQKAKQGEMDSEFGEALRTFFAGNRDVRIAETNQLISSFEKKVRSPIEQEALTLMRDFKNRMGELYQLADGTHEYYDKGVERFKKENPDATQKEVEVFAKKLLERGEKLRPLIEQALNPTKGMQQVDREMTQYFTSRLEEGKKLGFLESNLNPDEYINHLLIPKEEEPKTKGGGVSRNKVGRYFQFAKTRSYKDVVEANLNGVDPKTLNALHAMSIYGDKHATAAATQLLLKELKDSELGKFGTQKSEHIPSTWVPMAPESNLFKVNVPYLDTEGKPQIAYQQFFAPQKVVDALSAITQGDYLMNLPGIYRLKWYQGLVKGAELSLSVFHMRALSESALNNMGPLGIAKSLANDMESPLFQQYEREFVKAGLTTSILGRTIEAYHAARPSTQPTRMDLLRMTPGVRQLEKVGEYLTHQTFDVLQRKYKVTDATIKYTSWLAKHPQASATEQFHAMRAIAKEVNAVYGGLQREILGTNKTMQSLERIIMLAPDWTISNYYNLKYSFKGGPSGAAARRFLLTSLITGFLINQLWSLLWTGKMSKDPTKAYLGKDPTGKEVYTNIGFAGMPSDFINLIKNVQDYGLIQGFAQSLAAKQGPVMSKITQLFTNRDYLGQQIIPKGSGLVVGTARSAYELAQGLTPVPFSITNWISMLSDPTHKYIPPEFASILLGGGTSSHRVPDGMRQITSGIHKGQFAPATKHGAERPLLEQILTGKQYMPKRR